ncbi:hypothetical protein [Actinosynnema sp. NPDC023587]|uniref:VMAP-C domain-containing protein n=1 Tax=Actinosynnema sp. NPDC023587 TaxID=3154695 RepID=UPI0033CA72F9
MIHGDEDVAGGLLLPLVRALRQIPCLTDHASRKMVIRLLASELREPLTIEDHANPNVHLLNLAEACNQHPKRLAALLRALALMEQDSKPMMDLRRLVAGMHTLELFENDDLTRLLELLAGMVVPDIADIYRAVAGDAAPGLRRAMNYREVIGALENSNARPDGIPPPIVFIEHVAAKVRKELALELRRWVDDQAVKRGLVAEVESLREDLRTDPPDDVRPKPGAIAYVVLVLRTEGPTGDRYRLSTSRHLGIDDVWSPLPVGDRVDTLAGIKDHVVAVVEQAERDWAWYDPDIRVEFVLERDNINLAVDQWPAEADEAVPEPLGSRYSTVVRSLERNSDDKYLRLWRHRWRRLAGQARTTRPVARDGFVRADEAGQDGVKQLRGMLSRRQDVVSLLLSRPPHAEPEPQDEVMAAVKAGVPLIIWHREDCHADGLVRAVEYLLHDEDDEHPFLERVRRARATAFGENHSRNPCGDLTVLYDDPMRRVLPHRAAPPEEVALG